MWKLSIDFTWAKYNYSRDYLSILIYVEQPKFKNYFIEISIQNFLFILNKIFQKELKKYILQRFTPNYVEER